MTSPVTSILLRYAYALTVTALALGLRWAFDPWLGSQVPFITLFAAIALVAWKVGPGPAAVAALVGLVPTDLYFMPRRFVFPGGGAGAVLLHAIYFVSAALIILLGAVARRRGEQAERAARGLLASQSQLQLIVDSLPMLVSYIDARLRYRFNNRAYAEWFGHSPAALRGRQVREVIGDAAFDAVSPAMQRALAGETVQFETEVDYAAAGRRDVSVRYIPDHGPNGIEGFFALIEDVAERKRADLERAHLAAIFESADDAVVSKTLDGLVTSWNEGAVRLFGHDAGDMVGQSIERIIPDDLKQEEQEILARLRRGERIKHFETERLTRDGRRVPISLTISPIRDRVGKVIGASKIARDISERKQAEAALRKSEARFRTLADSAPILVWRADEANRGIWFNRSWLDFTGGDLEQHLGLGWIDAVHPEDREQAARICQDHFERRAPFEIEFRLRRHDGDYRWVLDRGVPMFDAPGGQFSGYIGSCLDISERHQAEQQRVEADRRKDEFLATLAHELRNPLAPILSAAQFMQRKSGADASQQSAAEIIERQARHMSRLVDDLLDLSRISRGRIVLRHERVPLELALSAAIEAARPYVDASGQQLRVSLPTHPVYVVFDSTRLAQIFGNLLSNAVKYTPRGGQIDLEVQVAGDEVVARIRDTGIGIKPELLERIFEMFTQADASLERRQGGLGIGLTLARQLVEMHGGRIAARSAGEGRGSEFELRIPLAPRLVEGGDGARADAQADAAGAQPRLRILVADDQADVGRSLKMVLELEGHEVHVVRDGLTAVDAVQRLRPDVALLDIGMPNLNGYDAARRIRAMSGGATLRLIALTGWGQEEDRRSALEAGFDEHCTKPIEMPALLRLLAHPRPASLRRA
jgi:PAS domain S-box-containing protein